MHHIFVYGTLKHDYANAHIGMQHSTFLGDYRKAQRCPLIIANKGYVPNLINEPGNGYQVIGELYEVDDSVLSELDQLESTCLPNGYRRVEISIEPIKAAGSPLQRASCLSA